MTVLIREELGENDLALLTGHDRFHPLPTVHEARPTPTDASGSGLMHGAAGVPKDPAAPRRTTMNPNARNTLIFALLGAFALLAAGCNTIQGAGKDVEAVGEEIQDVADDAKN